MLHESLKVELYIKWEMKLMSHREQPLIIMFVLMIIYSAFFAVLFCWITFQLLSVILFTIWNGLIREFDIYIPLPLGWNTFWFPIKMSLYPKSLNDALTLQAPSKNNFQVALERIFQWKGI